MRARAWLCALVASSFALGCGSTDDERPSVAPDVPLAGQATGGSSASRAGSSSGGSSSGGDAVSTAGGGGQTSGSGQTGGGGQTGGAGGSDGRSGASSSSGADGGGAGGVGGDAASCPAPLSVGDHSKLIAIERVDTYAVSGTTANELRQSINDNRGREYDALTTWNIDWKFQNCATPEWMVSLGIVYSMPSWDAPASADPALVASFQTYLDALYCHEYGHGQLALDCAMSVYYALTGLRGTGDCSEISALAQDQFDALLAGCKTRESNYDETTGHGATMGAVFPP